MAYEKMEIKCLTMTYHYIVMIFNNSFRKQYICIYILYLIVISFASVYIFKAEKLIL